MRLAQAAQRIAADLHVQAQRSYQVASMYKKDGRTRESAAWTEDSSWLAAKANRIMAWGKARASRPAKVHYFTKR